LQRREDVWRVIGRRISGGVKWAQPVCQPQCVIAFEAGPGRGGT
jgi:hypothetical protein